MLISAGMRVWVASGEHAGHTGLVLDAGPDSVRVSVDHPEETNGVVVVDRAHVKELDQNLEEIAQRLKNPRNHMPIKVHKREDLVFFARLAGVRGDWHEPDEQDISARFFGDSFDNAGPWAEEGIYYTIIEEHHVVLYYKGFPVIAVNLATLFAWATQD